MGIPIKSKVPSEVHLKINEDFKAVIAKYQDKLDAEGMLAIASHLVGILIALQDQRKMTHEMAIQIVMANIEAGNAEAMNQVKNETAGNA